MKLDAAINCYEKVLELKPEAANIHHRIANILQHQDKSEQASDRYQRGMEIKYSFEIYN